MQLIYCYCYCCATGCIPKKTKTDYWTVNYHAIKFWSAHQGERETEKKCVFQSHANKVNKLYKSYLHFWRNKEESEEDY